MKRNHGTKTGSKLFRNSTIVEPNFTVKQKMRKNNRRTKTATFDLRLGAPNWYQPLFSSVNMLLPRDRRERNEWVVPCPLY